MGAIAAAGSDVVGELTGANRAARAAQSAAQAREAELRTAAGVARTGLEDTTKRADEAILKAQSPEELSALTQALDQQGGHLRRQAQLFQSIDPAIMEASQQALQLLQGQEAKALGPIKENRKRQRQQLVDRLREQLGPGAETSTSGIQALNNFDQQSNEIFSQQQQQSLGQLFGMAQQGAQGRSALNQGTSVLANIGGQFGQRANRLANTDFAGLSAIQNARNSLVNAQQGVASGAGSQFVGEQLKGQAQQQLISQGIGLGAAALGAGAGGGGGLNFSFGGGN